MGEGIGGAKPRPPPRGARSQARSLPQTMPQRLSCPI